MSLHDVDIGAADSQSPRKCDGEVLNNNGFTDIHLPWSRIGVRISLASVGAFLSAVFPGVILVEHIAMTSRVFLGFGEFMVVYFILASVGGYCGIALYRTMTWSRPTAIDICLIFGVGILFGFLGFALMASLTPGT